MSSTEINKKTIQQFYEQAWNEKNLAIVDETHSPDWNHIDPSLPGDVSGGPDGNRERMNQVLSSFPDIHFDIQDMIAEGDKVVVRFLARGTHKGVFAGIRPTGKKVAMQGIIIHRLSEGQIVEDWVIRDTLGLLQQLGAVPAPGQPGR